MDLYPAMVRTPGTVYYFFFFFPGVEPCQSLVTVETGLFAQMSHSSFIRRAYPAHVIICLPLLARPLIEDIIAPIILHDVYKRYFYLHWDFIANAPVSINQIFKSVS